MRLNFPFTCKDSSMELIASSTDEVASNIDADADIAAFDTDLPAEHNVWMFSLFYCLHLNQLHDKHNHMPYISVSWSFGACFWCQIFRAEPELQFTNNNSQFASVSRRNGADDYIRIYVFANGL